MKRSLLLFYMLSTLITQAQVKNFSFKAGVNYPVIPTKTVETQITSLALPESSGFSPITVGSISLVHESKPGIDLGGAFDYSISRKFFISTGLNLSYLRFKKLAKIEKLSGGQIESDFDLPTTVGMPMGSFYGSIIYRDANGNVVVGEPRPETEISSLRSTGDQGKTSTLYLQVPVLVGTTFLHDKLIVRAGISVSYLLSASQYVDRYSYENQSVESHKETSRDGYTAILASCTVTTTYKITRMLGVDLSMNQFLSPIYNQSGKTSFKSKYSTLAFGLSYTLNP